MRNPLRKSFCAWLPGKDVCLLLIICQGCRFFKRTPRLLACSRAIKEELQDVCLPQTSMRGPREWTRHVRHRLWGRVLFWAPSRLPFGVNRRCLLPARIPTPCIVVGCSSGQSPNSTQVEQTPELRELDMVRAVLVRSSQNLDFASALKRKHLQMVSQQAFAAKTKVRNCPTKGWETPRDPCESDKLRSFLTSRVCLWLERWRPGAMVVFSPALSAGAGSGPPAPAPPTGTGTGAARRRRRRHRRTLTPLALILVVFLYDLLVYDFRTRCLLLRVKRRNHGCFPRGLGFRFSFAVVSKRKKSACAACLEGLRLCASKQRCDRGMSSPGCGVWSVDPSYVLGRWFAAAATASGSDVFDWKVASTIMPHYLDPADLTRLMQSKNWTSIVREPWQLDAPAFWQNNPDTFHGEPFFAPCACSLQSKGYSSLPREQKCFLS